jgi:hypothetical protein
MKPNFTHFTALLFILIVPVISAQESLFSKVFYDNQGSAQAYAMTKTSDGNFMIAGEKDNEGLVIKMNPAGGIIWAKKYGSYTSELFNDICPTNDGGYVMAGKCFYGTRLAFLIVKITAGGDTVWSRAFDPGYNAEAYSVQQTSDSGYILCGYTSELQSSPGSRMAVVKLDASGNLSWSKLLKSGTNGNYAYSIKETPDGEFVMMGMIEDYPDYYTGASLVNFSPSGVVNWSKVLVTGTSGNSMGLDVRVAEGGLECLSHSENYSILITKTDFDGNYLSGNSYPGYFGYAGFFHYRPPHLRTTSDSGYIFSAGGGMGSILIKIDSSMQLEWIQDPFLYPGDVAELDDKGFMVVGNGPIMGVSYTFTLNPQIGVIRTDSLGNSPACVYPEWSSSNTDPSYFTARTFDTITAGTVIPYYPVIEDAGLSADSGCVAFWGSTDDKQPADISVSVAPNPSNGTFNIVTENIALNEFRSIAIYNGMGNQVYQSGDPAVLQSPVKLEQAVPGVYMMKIVLKDQVLSQKFIIAR